MEVNVIKIGNSKGIRLSKTILNEYEIEGVVELELKDDHIEIRPKRKPRLNWEIALKEMVEDENEEILIPDVFEDEEL